MAVPVVILAAVDSSRAGETGMDEGGVADATDQAILVPGSVRHSHDVAIRNGQSASFAHLRQPQTSVNIRNHIRIGIRSNRPIRITHQDHPSGSPIRKKRRKEIETSTRPSSNLTAVGAAADADPPEAGPSEAAEST